MKPPEFPEIKVIQNSVNESSVVNISDLLKQRYNSQPRHSRNPKSFNSQDRFP